MRTKRALYRDVIRRMSVSAKFGWIVLFATLMIALFAPWICRHPPDSSSGPTLSPPSRTHPLGTDELGYDLWAQICFGARISLLVGLGTAVLSGIGGGIVGMFSGYAEGIVDKVIMRMIDMMIVLPDLPVMIVLAAFLGPSVFHIIIVLALFSWVFTARIVRSQVLTLKRRYYIKSAEMYGAGAWYLIRKHFFPEIFPLVGVSMIRLTGRAIVAEAGLSFLGLGDPTSKSWGLIIHHATSFSGIYYTQYWQWWLLYPWMALTLMVASLGFISRDLESVLEPQLK